MKETQTITSASCMWSESVYRSSCCRHCQANELIAECVELLSHAIAMVWQPSREKHWRLPKFVLLPVADFRRACPGRSQQLVGYMEDPSLRVASSCRSRRGEPDGSESAEKTYCGNLAWATGENSLVKPSIMKATTSAFSWSVNFSGFILSLSHLFRWPPLSYHSTTSSSVF